MNPSALPLVREANLKSVNGRFEVFAATYSQPVFQPMSAAPACRPAGPAGAG
jgi:hypothetical protein